MATDNKKFLDLDGLNYYNDKIKAKMTAEQNARIDTDTRIQSQVNGLASGTPLVASSVAGMTDTTRVYVNTSDGNWYYYDNGWLAGGVYQSQGLASNVDWDSETNNLLSLEGIVVTQKVDNTLAFEQGSISSSNGVDATSPVTTRIRSEEYVDFNSELVKVELPSTYKFKLFSYLKSDNSYQSATAWLTNITSTEVNKNYKYRILVANIDDSDIPASDYANLKLYDACSKYDSDITSLDSRLDAAEEPVDYNRLEDSLKEDILNCEKNNVLNYIVDVEQGSIQGSTGIYTTSTQRIRTTSTLHFNSDKIDIHVASGYKCDIYEYSDTYNITGNYVGHHGWMSADTTVEVSNNSFYRVVMAKTDDSTVDVDIISNFAIYDIQNFTEARAEQLQKKNNNIPKLIAHRGLTCIRSENTLPAYYACSRYGIKYVKCDIQVTSDHKYVCSHQEKMEYPFVTPADNAYINTLTLSQIQSDYYISGPMYDTLYFEKLRMPSFEEALVCFRENNIIPFIDMKTGTDYKYVYNLLVKYGFKDNIYLFTSRKEVLNAFYALDKNIKLFYWGTFTNADVSYLQKFKNADVGYAMDYSDLSADRVKMLHEKGIEVGTYPINDYTNIQNAIDYGCDYIQSDSCQFGLQSDFRAKNLDFTPNGTGNYSLTIPDSDAWIFTDYLELEMEVYYESPYTLTITCGEKTLVDNQPNKWHKIKMQKIKLNNGISLNVNCTDPDFMYLDRRVTLYTNKQG